MPRKNYSGENNPFYGKKHSEKSKKKMGGAAVDYSGENNPFYGKTHTKENIEKMRERMGGKVSGSDNPFYGKSHSNESLDKIRESNRKHREENKNLILERQLKRLNLNEEKLRSLFLKYKNSEINSDDLQKEAEVDKRVIFKYIKLFKIATTEEIEKIKMSKKMKRSKSSPELKLYNFLSEKYGAHNVIWSHKIGRFFYDFFVLNSILIEYDGYYWHNCRDTNDDKKNSLAKELGIPLIRIAEPESRKTDFNKEFKRINEAIDEIQTSRNNLKKEPSL